MWWLWHELLRHATLIVRGLSPHVNVQWACRLFAKVMVASEAKPGRRSARAVTANPGASDTGSHLRRHLA